MNPTPPVHRDGFEYYNHEFYAVSNNKPYRRYSVAELRALFNTSSSKSSVQDQPAHWYRAQLLHYGLPPTDRKGTAMMRLLDAMNRDALEIPANLKKLERDLKKEWDANQKKAKDSSEKSSSSTKKTTKRKADTAFNDINDALGSGNLAAILAAAQAAGPTVNINVNIGGMDSKQSQPSAKKAKAEPKSQKKEAPKKEALKKDTAKKEAKKPAPKDAPKKEIVKKEAPKKTVVKKEVVKREVVTKEVVKKETIKKEVVKREVKKEITPKTETTMKKEPTRDYHSTNSSPPRLSLGLLNGSYKIDSQDVNTRNSGMILCLDKTSIWGEFQIGDLEGILFMPQRPYQVTSSSEGGCSFEWRGVDQESGESFASPNCTGEIRFLGNGEIEGTFHNVPGRYSDFDCDFWGHRTSAKDETRAPRDAWSMRDEWNSFFD